MNNTYIGATRRTPEINFKYDEGSFEIKGNSMPENTEDFYHSLAEEFGEYAKDPATVTKMSFGFMYYNTATARAIHRFFRKLNEIHLAGHAIVVKWHYEEDDEEMKESAEYYQHIVDFDIELVSVAEWDLGS